jgi:OOP family OmpA-OmpF porin
MSFGCKKALAGAALVFGAQWVGLPLAAQTASPDEGVVCNPVYDGDGTPVVQTDGRYVKHGGTYACPQPEPEPVAAPEPAPAPTVITIAADVAFDFDKADIREEFKPELDRIAQELNESPETRLDVVGHADSTGPEDYNQRLSERRAQAVADYLIGAGVAADRFTVSGRGESDPVASNDSREGRAQNRRVDIHSQ